MLTILAGIIFLTLFPTSPSNPTSLLHHTYFTPRESQILHRRILLDDATKSQLSRHVSLTELKHVSFGFDRLRANAMTSIGAWILLLTNIAWGMISDRIGKRGPIVTLGLILFWGATVRFLSSAYLIS